MQQDCRPGNHVLPATYSEYVTHYPNQFAIEKRIGWCRAVVVSLMLLQRAVDDTLLYFGEGVKRLKIILSNLTV